jgi:ppGpp synthetase/RelA/SpoT-type nucleotidyltranferase
MGVIEDFIGRYRKEYDFYDQAARLVAQLLEARLQAAGVRAMVTFRAKAVGKLERKVRDRAKRKNYATVENIYTDIPDLAGARVALYFPAQREQVEMVINEIFNVVEKKIFPDMNTPRYEKRFSGYSATHYRVRLREGTLVDSQKRYAEAPVEIQVASVLMHAWSEVEHDLVYKPYQGLLSEDEYAILDELNGMVMAGEIALERLQRAGDVRVAVRDRKFANHYELAAHLLSVLRGFAEPDALKSGLGRVDLLYELLARLALSTPEAVGRYLEALHPDLERRPIADQRLCCINGGWIESGSLRSGD